MGENYSVPDSKSIFRLYMLSSLSLYERFKRSTAPITSSSHPIFDKQPRSATPAEVSTFEDCWLLPLGLRLYQPVSEGRQESMVRILHEPIPWRWNCPGESVSLQASCYPQYWKYQVQTFHYSLMTEADNCSRLLSGSTRPMFWYLLPAFPMSPLSVLHFLKLCLEWFGGPPGGTKSIPETPPL
jgi:hypothetical protein